MPARRSPHTLGLLKARFPSPAASIAAKTLESKTAISISGGERSWDAIKDSVTKAARHPGCFARF
jgi:hypothetical protein